MANRLFVPNSPTLMNAGAPLGQLSAWLRASGRRRALHGKTASTTRSRAMALVHQSGGGTGSASRGSGPRNDIVRSTMGVASGPVSFMRLFDARPTWSKQGGTRRGANMGICAWTTRDINGVRHLQGRHDQDHHFQHLGRRTDDFMAAVEATACTNLHHPKTGKGRRAAQMRARSGRRSSTAPGRPASQACSSSTRPITTIRCRISAPTRPPTPAVSSPSCRTMSANLGSINLGAFVKDGEIDWDHLRMVVHLSTHFLENVIDANQYPLPEITELAQRIRRIGLGVMGLADLFIKLGIPYDSEEGVALGRRIQQFVTRGQGRERAARPDRGVFPEWERSIWGPDKTAARGPKASGSARCAASGTATSPRWHRPAPSRSSPAAARESSRSRRGLHAEPGRRCSCPTSTRTSSPSRRPRAGHSEDLMHGSQRRAHRVSRSAREVAARVRHRQPHQPEWHIRMQGAFPGVTTAPSRRPATSPTTRPRRTWRRSTASPTASTARA